MHTCLHHTRTLEEILKQKTVQSVTKNEIPDLNSEKEYNFKIDIEFFLFVHI